MVHLAVFDQESIKKFTLEFEQVFYKGDGKEMAAYYTKDAQLIGEGVNIKGRSAIEDFWHTTCQHAVMLKMKRSITLDSIETTDSMCYAVCTLSLQIETLNGTVNKKVKDVTIWKYVDGIWQIEMDISTPLS